MLGVAAVAAALMGMTPAFGQDAAWENANGQLGALSRENLAKAASGRIRWT